MAKKNCDFETQVVNGGQMGLAMFIVGLGASVLKRLKKPHRTTARKTKAPPPASRLPG